MRQPRHHFGSDPRYPLQGFTVLEREPGITFVRLDEVEAYSTNILTGETTRLGPEHEFVKLFDQVEYRPLEALNGHVRLAIDALHDRPLEGMATVTPIRRSTT